jgi:hypothetical protein
MGYYSAGDPGFFDWVGGALKTVARVAAPIVGGAVGSLIPIPGLGTAIGMAAGGALGGALGSMGGETTDVATQVDAGPPMSGLGAFGGSLAAGLGTLIRAQQQPAYNNMVSFAQPPAQVPYRSGYSRMDDGGMRPAPQAFAFPRRPTMMKPMPMSVGGFDEDEGGMDDYEEEDY